MGLRRKSRLNKFGLTVALASQLSSTAALAAGTPVSEDELKSWTDWVKKSISTLDQREKRIEQKESALQAGGSGANGQAVDLSNPAAVDAASMPGGMAPVDTSKEPRLETYFDFALVNQPGTYDSLAFDNYHSFVFFDINPTPNLSFSFNLLGPQTFPVYYELDYQATKKLQLRAGKIFIPFDDLSIHSPHNIFGGREGLAQLMPSGTTDGVSGNNGGTFLPSLWTELGVGLKYMVIDNQALQFETDMTITNGFPPTGQDPVTGDVGPNFSPGFTPAPQSEGSGSGTARRNKSIDLRGHALFGNRFGIGASMYQGQWNNDQGSAVGPGHLFLSMEGMDSQIYFAKGVELRGGFAVMSVEYPEGVAKRAGSYLELGVPFRKKWKALVRYGTLQLDNRIAESTDMNVAGIEILYNPGAVQFSLETNKDIKNPNVPVGFTSYTNLRMIMLF